MLVFKRSKVCVQQAPGHLFTKKLTVTTTTLRVTTICVRFFFKIIINFKKLRAIHERCRKIESLSLDISIIIGELIIFIMSVAT